MPNEPYRRHDDAQQSARGRYEARAKQRKQEKTRRTLVLAAIALGLAIVVLASVMLIANCGGCGGAGNPISSGISSSSVAAPIVPSSSVGQPVISSAPESVAVPETSSEAASSSPEPSSSSEETKPAPTFIENTPAVVSVSGFTVTVSYKTDVSSTVNAVLANVGNTVSTGVFYDFTRRGVNFEGAISHKSTNNVTSAGVTETFTLPDTSVPYYLIVNAVENETGTWQNYTTVIVLYNPTVNAPFFTSTPVRQNDTDANYVWTVQTSAALRVWGVVVATGSTAPTAAQIRDNSYTGTTYGQYTLDTTGTQSPYSGTLNVPRNSLGKGNYSIWLVCQKAGDTSAPISAPIEVAFTVS